MPQKVMEIPLVGFLFFIALIHGINAQESGTSTVKKALEKLKKFDSKGQEFLKNIAKVESKYGTDKNTYREGYHGGIWQVDDTGFKDTQDTKSHPKLKERYVKIKELYGIDWEKVTWEDLRDPFKSALAARLRLLNIDDPLPAEDDVDAQAEYWKKYYNTEAGKGTVEKFKDDVENLKDSAIGDPHLMIQLPSGESVCYDLISKHGDIVRLFRSEKFGISVNGGFPRPSRSKHLVKRFDKGAVIIKAVKIGIFMSGIIVNGIQKYKWSTRRVEKNGIVIKITSRHVTILNSGLEVEIRKGKTGLNIIVHHPLDMDLDGHYIFGAIAKKIDHVRQGKPTKVVLKNGREIQTKEKSKAGTQCLQLPRDFFSKIEMAKFKIPSIYST